MGGASLSKDGQTSRGDAGDDRHEIRHDAGEVFEVSWGVLPNYRFCLSGIARLQAPLVGTAHPDEIFSVSIRCFFSTESHSSYVKVFVAFEDSSLKFAHKNLRVQLTRLIKLNASGDWC